MVTVTNLTSYNTLSSVLL